MQHNVFVGIVHVMVMFDPSRGKHMDFNAPYPLHRPNSYAGIEKIGPGMRVPLTGMEN
jgi:hypothetical protein